MSSTTRRDFLRTSFAAGLAAGVNAFSPFAIRLKAASPNDQIGIGVVGLGGGYALVPGLIYLFGAPVYLTMGTSLATMIPLALVGGGIKLAGGYVALAAASLLAGGTIVGAQIGAAVIKRFKPANLKLIFGVYFLYVSIKFIAAYFGVSIW